MAIAASAVWRVRAGGNALNGGVYDGTSYAGGTDYSQQDAAQATFAATLSTSAANSTTLLNSANTFTSAMVGNAIQIASGTNAIAGFYFVTAFASAGSVTLDRTPATAGALAGGTGRLGGALNHFTTVMNNNNATGAKVAPGNTIYVRGGGTDFPGTADYTTTTAFIQGAGGSSAGMIRLRAENGRPRVDCAGLLFHIAVFLDIQGFLFVFTSTSNSNFGIVNGTSLVLRDCIFDQAGLDATAAQVTGFIGSCEVFSSVAPIGAQTLPGLLITNNGSTVENNFVHDCVFSGIATTANGNSHITNNVVTNNRGSGITLTGTQASGNYNNRVSGNTVSGNAGNGIEITDTTGVSVAILSLYNNLIANQVGAGKAGLFVGGTQSTNDNTKLFIDGNVFYNNTAHASGVAIGATSVTLGADPFVSVSTEDYSLISSQAGTAPLPGTAFRQHTAGKVTTMRSYLDPGAVQRQEPSASSSVLRRPSLNGVG